jgi:hypothetical protein
MDRPPYTVIRRGSESPTVEIPARRLVGRQVLRSELDNLARCAKRSSADDQFFGIFAGAAIGLLANAVAPGLDPWYRFLYVGFAIVCGLVSYWVRRRTQPVEEEAARILRQIEDEQEVRAAGLAAGNPTDG